MKNNIIETSTWEYPSDFIVIVHSNYVRPSPRKWSLIAEQRLVGLVFRVTERRASWVAKHITEMWQMKM